MRAVMAPAVLKPNAMSRQWRRAVAKKGPLAEAVPWELRNRTLLMRPWFAMKLTPC